MSGRKHPWGDCPPIMQVICPNCDARYAVDPLAIGPTGRTVECARCHHRWRERMVGREISHATALPPSLAMPPPLPAPSLDAAPEVPALPPIEMPQAVPDFIIRPTSSHKSGLPALTSPPPESHRGLWLTGAAALLATLATAAYIGRGEILPYLPDDWRVMPGLDAIRALLRQ